MNKSELVVGDSAPPFSTCDQTGRNVSLSDFKGKKVVLYFYPKDDTPGCTKEACEFRDSFAAFTQKNIVILGVSPDSQKSHERFREKFNLPFSLLSDPDKSIAQAYGVWVEKSMYGKAYMGVERSTFVIDPDGLVAAIHRKVKPETHPGDLLSSL